MVKTKMTMKVPIKANRQKAAISAQKNRIRVYITGSKRSGARLVIARQ
jgi:hypothetical protein